MSGLNTTKPLVHFVSNDNLCLTLGEVDEDGNHETYNNGKKTNIKVRI